MIDLKGIPIHDHTQLKLRIMHLNAKKEEQEEAIKNNVKELFYSIHPAHMLKNAVADLAKDEGLRADLGKLGLTLGADFLAGKLFGKHRSVKSYLSGFVFQKLATHFVHEYQDLISEGFHRIRSIFRKKKYEFEGA